MNKIVEREGFGIDSVRVKSAELKDVLLEVFTAFYVSLV